MAKIETYSNDTNVTLLDKVIGTDALDNSTKNFTVGDIVALAGSGSLTAGTGIDITNDVISCTVTDTDTTYTAGTGIEITNGVISSTVVDTDTTYTAGNGIYFIGTTILNGLVDNLRKMYVAQMNIPVLNVDPTPIVIPMDPFFSENTGGWIAYSNNEIVNVYDGALSLKLTMHGFNTSLGNNNDLSYILEKWDGSSWAEVKRVSRTKSAPGDYADMFGGYFQLLYNQKFRVLAVSGTGGIQLTQGTALEIQVLA